jgi:hypothetical protein
MEILMMKNAVLTAAAFALLAGPASALSCMAPDIVRSYEYAAEHEKIYFLFKGKISLVEDQTMPTERESFGADAPVEVTLEPVYGSFVGEIFNEGVFVPYEATMEVQLDCVASWCGSYPDEKEALYFVSAAESNLWFNLEMSPCGGTRFDVKEADALIAHLEEKGAEWGEPDIPEDQADVRPTEEENQ